MNNETPVNLSCDSSANQDQPIDNTVGRIASREEVDQSRYWDEIYRESEDNSPGWNLGEANPEFLWQIDHAKPALPRGKLLVPGCGYGHDAIAFAKAKWQVTGLDFADSAVVGAKANAQRQTVELAVVQGDVFALPEDWRGEFDAVLEHTCYCAIHPSRRGEYLNSLAKVLRVGGEFFGLIYAHGKEGGPPWHCDPEEFRLLAGDAFDVIELERAKHNVEHRAGKEVWVRLRKRA